MPKYRLVGKIIEIKGVCHAGHVVGEEIDLTLLGEEASAKGIRLCPFFFNALFPYLCVLQFGGRFPWEEDPDVYVAGCPDIENMVKIRIKRIPIEEKG
jgi:uncharacterized repeat protein (TIGR04076 family)